MTAVISDRVLSKLPQIWWKSLFCCSLPDYTTHFFFSDKVATVQVWAFLRNPPRVDGPSKSILFLVVTPNSHLIHGLKGLKILEGFLWSQPWLSMRIQSPRGYLNWSCFAIIIYDPSCWRVASHSTKLPAKVVCVTCRCDTLLSVTVMTQRLISTRSPNKRYVMAALGWKRQN